MCQSCNVVNQPRTRSTSMVCWHCTRWADRILSKLPKCIDWQCDSSVHILETARGFYDQCACKLRLHLICQHLLFFLQLIQTLHQLVHNELFFHFSLSLLHAQFAGLHHSFASAGETPSHWACMRNKAKSKAVS